MKGNSWIVAVLALAAAAGMPALVLAATGFVVDSPFDLTLGSTNYAVRLGKAVHSSASAWYDPATKVTTTNWSAYATVRFAKPYHGAKEANLQFRGEDRVLDSYSFDIGAKGYGSGGTLTVAEARKVMQEVAEDISKRFGVKMEPSMFGEGELSDADIDKRVEEMSKGGSTQVQMAAISFANLSGRGEREGVGVGYGISGMFDGKKMCRVSVHVYTSWRPRAKDAVKPIGETSVPGLVSEAEQKKAHEEAKGLRGALAKLFGVDFDSTEGKDFAKGAMGWVAMEKPVAGLDERKPDGSRITMYQVPFVVFSARRAYPGDVEESELRRQAQEVLDCIESAYGAKVPTVDIEKGLGELAKVLGDGVPTFGDSRAILGLDKVQTLVGKVGDLAVEIAYALPRYERKGGDYRLVRRGAVVLNITQSPILAPNKALQTK